jgi:hypothetical protein
VMQLADLRLLFLPVAAEFQLTAQCAPDSAQASSVSV